MKGCSTFAYIRGKEMKAFTPERITTIKTAGFAPDIYRTFPLSESHLAM
jgi:hypothetical protein